MPFFGKKTKATFEEGQKVTVSGYDGEGTVRFVGKEAGGGKSRIGVEMDKPVGKNNGTVKGHTYFTCEKKHGLLSLPKNVVHVDPEDGKDSDSGGEEEEAAPPTQGGGVLAALASRQGGASKSRGTTEALATEEKSMTVRERVAAAKEKAEAERDSVEASKSKTPHARASQTWSSSPSEKSKDVANATARQERMASERQETRDERADFPAHEMSDAQVAEREWFEDVHSGPQTGKYDAQMNKLSQATIDEQVKSVLKALLSKYAGNFEVIAKEAAEFKACLKDAGINPDDPGVTLDEGGITKFLVKHDATRPDLSGYMARIHLEPRGKKGERRYPFIAYIMLKLGLAPQDIFALELEKLDPFMQEAHQAIFTYADLIAQSKAREERMTALREVCEAGGLHGGRARVELASLKDQHDKEARPLVKARQDKNAGEKYLRDNDPLDIENRRLAAKAEEDAASAALKRQSSRQKIKDMQAAFFNAADTDGDGEMSWDEARAKGMDRSTFNNIDGDGDGKVTQEEFAVWQASSDQLLGN